MITVPFDPNIFDSGSFTLSWHGFLSFIAVGGATFMVGRWARKANVDPDIIYNVAVFAIVGGIIGARFVHVADNWSFYSDNPANAFQVWAGGISVWGGILGGWLGGLAYAIVYNAFNPKSATKVPIGRVMDLAAPAVIIAQAIGRVGDFINGEHWSKATDLAWGWVFTDFDSPGFRGPPLSRTDVDWDPTQATHPTVAYEAIGDVLIFMILWKLRGKFSPHGSLWMIYLALYAMMRFGVQFLRIDEEKFWGLQQAHIIAIIVVAVTVPWMVYFMRRRDSAGSADPGDAGERPTRTGSRRRRRRRATA